MLFSKTSCSLLILFFCCITMAATAQQDPVFIQVLKGDSIKTGKKIMVKDSVFFDPLIRPTIKHTELINNIISLRINEDVAAVLPDSFSFSLNIKVRYLAADTLADSVNLKTLTIDYNKNKAYNNKAIFLFTGAHYVEAEVLSLQSQFADTAAIRKLLLLENRMVIERIYNLSCTADSIRNLSKKNPPILLTREVEIFWTPSVTAQMYDVEWAFLDQSAIDAGIYSIGGALNPALIFKNNATRVTTQYNQYALPLLFDGAGVVFYRVRGVQIDQFGEVVTTKWTSELNPNPSQWRHNFSGHENNLNWQATTSFAEDGKRKSVVQYYDGSLRARQTVTRDNTTKTTIVAETLYDKQGRPVIQVMPAPTLNTILGFTPLFNVAGANSEEYDQERYDPETFTDDCGKGADSMHLVSGASNYYSTQNPEAGLGYHQFIPDAKNYPFTETQYTADNTGRIARQGGVGAGFQLGSGKETKYFYAAADQHDLDALFGTEVGDATHYQKNMVRDANGQYSVSYVDMHGRTIATALAGTPPANLDPLSSYQLLNNQTEQMLNKTNNVINGTSVEFSKTILMTKADSVSFHYSMGKKSLTIEDCKLDSICYDCLYDLTITISGDCDNTVSERRDTTITISNFLLWQVDTTCGLATPIDKVIKVFLKEGSYNVSKVLSLNKEAMQKYRDSVFLPRNTCISFDSMYRKQLQILKDSLNCNTDTAAGINYLFYRDRMLLDLYPLLGQYADTAKGRLCSSIFDRAGGGAIYGYQILDNGCYKDEQGNCDLVENSQGVMVQPQNLTIDEFIAYFKPSWAEALLKRHPEYLLLQQWERLADSHLWDDAFGATETYADAFAKGYLNPTNSTSTPANGFGLGNDPIIGYSFTNGVKIRLEDSLLRFRAIPNSSNKITLWGFATAVAKCPESATAGITQACVEEWNQTSKVFGSDLCVGEKDMAWRTFRDMYLEWKRDYIDDFIRAGAGVPYPVEPNCMPVFPIKDSLMVRAGYSIDGGGQNVTTGQNQAQAFYEENCNAYRDRWREQLGNCYTEVQKDSIINNLVQVCIAGADADHPLGASTIKPGTSSRFTSFVAVVNHFNLQFNVTDTLCTAYLLDKPLPYGKPMLIVQQTLFSKPDSCTCDKITTLYNQYTSNIAGYSSFSNYIQQRLNTTISQGALDSLRSLCSGAIACKFISSPVMLPPALQCGVNNVCINCGEFSDAYHDFSLNFPSIVPTEEEVDTIQQLRNRVFANFMNSRFGFAKTAQDYLSFINECGLSTDTSTCTQLSNAIVGFQPYYDSVTSINGHIPIRDRGNCDVYNWNINNGGWAVDSLTFRWNDFLQNGVVKQPVLDTVNKKVNYNFLARNFCIDSGFTAEVRLRFPIDSARKAVYVRNGGDASVYGRVTYNLNLHNKYLFAVTQQTGVTGAFPGYIQYNSVQGQNISYQLPDSSLLIDYSQWRVVKIKFHRGNDTIFLDNVPIRAFVDTVPLGTLFGFAVLPTGYDLEIDWVRFYDGRDSLRLDEDFSDCNWNNPGFNSSCNYSCDSLFKSYFNQRFNSSISYDSIRALYTDCNIPFNICNAENGPLLCGKNEPMNPIVDLQPNPCADTADFAFSIAYQLYQYYQDSIKNHFSEAYTKKCLNISGLESFTITRPISEYHYTLYYYDQAGNLVKTIPPAGVQPNRDAQWLAQVAAKREVAQSQTPTHQLQTVYQYNSLNQVVTQKTPDAGAREFWYDRLGRLVISRNAKQKIENAFSYTKYDALGRITEVGQKPHVWGMSQLVSRNAFELNKWISFRNNDGEFEPKMVTLTGYDLPSLYSPVYEGCTPFAQKAFTLRNRVSFTRYFNSLQHNLIVSPTGDTSYSPHSFWFQTAVEYNYDIHGNVDSLLNIASQGSIMNSFGCNAFKLIAYKYDLISGKVNEVHYQPSNATMKFADEFYHRYSYDADNKLVDVYTADHKAFINQPGLEEHEAHYQYYKHGPLSRTVLGQQQVQGIDYAYNLQGWLKGVNSTSLNSTFDMGEDGKAASANSFVGRDALGFNLNYFTGDYAAISNKTPFPGSSAFMPAGAFNRQLYNGNITSMAVNIGKLQQPQLYAYSYDQLNRLTGMDVLRGLNQTTNTWGPGAMTHTPEYKERITYDGNGNIQKYLRQGINPLLGMDSLSYHYTAGTNKLDHIKDPVWMNDYSSDIDNQPAGNYHYDAIGNLTEDSYAGVHGIEWNVYGKLKKMNRFAQAGEAGEIIYHYDPSGNRVGKTFWINSGTGRHQWYVRDAQGNVMAVYDFKYNSDWSAGPLKLVEHHVYGSSRLGIVQRNQDMMQPKAVAVNEDLLGPTFVYNSRRGEKFFELSNHLGNVLTTVSDKKVGVDLSPADGSYDYYEADVVSAMDYAPFGMELVGRAYSSPKYRYGFNGKEKDDEVKGSGAQYDYGFRIYDPRVGRFLSVDPLTQSYPWYTPYQFAGNKPTIAIDLDGLEEKTIIHHLSKHPDGQFYVKSIDVAIDHNVRFINYDAATGKKSETARTNVYAEYGGKTSELGFLDEDVTPGGMKPSAAYDYTSEASMKQKDEDDKKYYGYNPIKFFKAIKRDLNARDHAGVEDVQQLGQILATLIPIKIVNRPIKANQIPTQNSSKPPINPQKQAGHVPGTPQNKNRMKVNKATSTFKDRETADNLTQEAWAKGTVIRTNKNGTVVKEYDFKKPIGSGPNGGTQSKVRVHSDEKGQIHGHPSGPIKN